MGSREAATADAILIVDDDEHVRILVKTILSEGGYRVLEASSGGDALELMTAEPVDLVLMDVRMPQMDGFETVERMRRRVDIAALPVVFLTVQSDLRSRQRALELGAADFISKPIHRTELLVRLRSLLWVRRLQREVGGLYDLVRTQRDTLLSARRQRADLMAFVVHDLAHPVSATMMSAIELDRLADLPPEGRGPVAAILDASDTMRMMLQNLRGLSESDEGSLELHVGPVALDRMVREVVEGQRSRSEHLGHTVSLRIPSSVPEALADALNTRRVLDNLLDNALKYSPPGSGIELEVIPMAGELVVAVSDQGRGVPASERERIFDRYYRLERDRGKHGREGSGLGLAFCKLVLDAQSGRIWVEDREPSGARFCFSLPLAASVQPPA